MSTANPAGFHHAHHFDSAEQQYQTSKQGIWLFLVTEILMFGGLFVAYSIYHSLYPQIFHAGSKQLSISMGAVNTVVLLFSSFTMALGINFVQRGLRTKAIIALTVTILCAAIFMVVKYFEYTHKFHVGTVPGKYAYTDEARTTTKVAALVKEAGEVSAEEREHKLHMDEEEYKHLRQLNDTKNWPLFFGFYFVMTGIHGLHVLAGAFLIFWVLMKVVRNKVGPDYYTPVEGVGLFWHVVDLIWIYLFPLLYLVG
ncbi:cytochrome c oxidase, subunit III domain protein [Leptospira broomii serovar Hurstbridge str. 5399]|uniref:Cytochrome c oxidase, subunit III domain protein n=1 Tax=Leptospira broomii serovar Hurstbridge str. 5399 TaxID=1049789 RepID=T0FC50_9LEPT|nr:cytochrome c oxidase subunit 3 family protein [Leptospira broomii]EQA45451.1 cytochrome c oxidase, subunit III domain protein [Leptospira broomii serovar Hurstbridge str. 5399]